MAVRRSPLSLKGRGLALLAQREHSRAELKRKLMPHARAELAAIAKSAESADPVVVNPQGAHHETLPDENASPASAPAAAERVAEVLDWLQAHRYLSEERFTESRVHARGPKFGNLRIRHELSQHGVALTAEQSQRLAETELERAREVRLRKFDQPPASAAEHARQTRFLAGRGFSSAVVRQLMRQIGCQIGPATGTEAAPEFEGD